MKALRNSVQLIGNTGKSVELKTFDSGSKKASVSFATTDYYKNTKGELVTQTQWHNLVAWGRNAELLTKVVEVGDQLIIKGSINYRSYDDSNGVTKYITEILVDEFLKTTKDSNSTKTKAPKAAAKTSKKEAVLPF